jgi:disulfide bond formation protein DsbB
MAKKKVNLWLLSGLFFIAAITVGIIVYQDLVGRISLPGWLSLLMLATVAITGTLLTGYSTVVWINGNDK